MILQLFRERIGQASESADAHSHRKVLPLYETGAHMLWVGVATHDLHVATDAGCRGVALLVIAACAVDFLQLSIITVRSKCALNSLQISLVAIRRDLYAITNTISG
jgi:hypothetical protein